MDYLVTVLLVFVLGCLVHLERTVAGLKAEMKLLNRNSCGKKKRKGVKLEKKNDEEANPKTTLRRV